MTVVHQRNLKDSECSLTRIVQQLLSIPISIDAKVPRSQRHSRLEKGPLDRAGLLKLLGAGGASVPVSAAFQAVQQFAAEGTRKTAWAGIFGSANSNEFEYTFTLTNGMMNGVYFDDQDEAVYEVECLSGSCEWQITSATDADWDKVDPVRVLASGEAANGKFEVKFRKTLIKMDATILLKVTGTVEGVSKVRVKLKARDK